MSLLKQSQKNRKKKSPVEPKLPVPPSVAYESVLVALVLVLMGALVVLGFNIYTRNQISVTPTPAATVLLTPTLNLNATMIGVSTRDFVKQACQATFYHQRDQLTTEQYDQGCDTEARRVLLTYPAGVSYCAEHDTGSISVFMACLKRREVGFSFTTVTSLSLPTAPAPTVPPYVAPVRTPYVAPVSSYPENCADAIWKGMDEYEAGAYAHLDRDGDGVACYGD